MVDMTLQLKTLNRHLTAENEHRMEETLATLHPDCIFEDRAVGEDFHGRAGAERYYRMWWDAFDLKVVSERRHKTEDGAIISEARYQGTHKGDFLGYPASGRPVDFPLAVIITFRDNLLAGERFYYDVATLLRQIGADTSGRV
jgi:steroid delta-isomerase-like uncharacterized protein